jgi:threonine dehydrogenase-like Zn-dependent dehydrogenase
VKAKTATLVAPKKFEIIEKEISEPCEGEVLLRVLSVGLCHSDIPGYLGEHVTVPNRYGNSVMTNEVEFPRVPGHEPIGVVEAVGRGVTTLKVGDYAGGPVQNAFASYIIADTRDLHVIPSNIRNLKYCLIEPLMCCANIVKIANPEFGEYVGVIGCGMMGLMIIAGLRRSGAREIIAIDLLDSRLEYAKKYGASITINPKTQDLDKIIFEVTENNGVDVVIEITGSLKGLNTATRIARHADFHGYKGRGKLLIPSLYGRDEPWDPAIGFNLMTKSLVIHSAHPWYSLDMQKDLETGLWAYTKGIMPIDEIITHEFSLENIGEGFKLMASGDPSYFKGVVLP